MRMRADCLDARKDVGIIELDRLGSPLGTTLVSEKRRLLGVLVEDKVLHEGTKKANIMEKRHQNNEMSEERDERR